MREMYTQFFLITTTHLEELQGVFIPNISVTFFCRNVFFLCKRMFALFIFDAITARVIESELNHFYKNQTLKKKTSKNIML